jgi:hypothetical protein
VPVGTQYQETRDHGQFTHHAAHGRGGHADSSDKTLDNYIQYVRTQKRIMYAQTKRHVLVDNFLCVVDED